MSEFFGGQSVSGVKVPPGFKCNWGQSVTMVKRSLGTNCKGFLFTQYSEGIKYSNQEYTRVGYPILGYFRVQVPENL